MESSTMRPMKQRLVRIAAIGGLVAVTALLAAVAAPTMRTSLLLAGQPAREADDLKPYTETIAGTDVKFDMLPIPGGKFMMGSPASEKGRNADEGPAHEVQIQPFW